MTFPDARSWLQLIDVLLYGTCAVVFGVRTLTVFMAGGSGWLVLGYLLLCTATVLACAAHCAEGVDD